MTVFQDLLTLRDMRLQMEKIALKNVDSPALSEAKLVEIESLHDEIEELQEFCCTTCTSTRLPDMARPVACPSGSWPLEMRSETAAAYCDEPSVDAFLAKVSSGVYSQPARAPGALPKWHCGMMFGLPLPAWLTPLAPAIAAAAAVAPPIMIAAAVGPTAGLML